MSTIISGGHSCTTHPTTITTNNPFIVTPLPKEIFSLIFSRLKDSDIVHTAETNKHFYYLLTYVPLWEARLRDYFPDSYANLTSPAESPFLYKRLRITDHNIKKGNFILSAFFCHKDEVTALALSGNLLVSGSRNGTIKIWDIKSKQELHLLEGHKDEVTNILICDGMAISGSLDNTIKIWNLIDGKLLQTFEGYQGRKNSLAVYGDHLIVGQLYGALRIWDLKSRQRLKALKGTQNQIQCITVCGDQLFSGSSDGTIAIWDLKTGKELTILRTNQGGIASVVAYNGKLISGALHFNEGSIEIWNLKSGQIQAMNVPTTGPIRNLVACDGKLFYTYSRKINVLDLETEEVHLIANHGNNIINGEILFCNGQLIVATGKRVGILDFTDPSLLPPFKVRPPFLADLGIVTEQACLQKLKCCSDFLSKIGICSSADVQALGVTSPDFHYLEVVSEEADNNYIKLEDNAHKKAKIISSFLETLLEAVQKKSDQANHYGTDNIWIIFQNKLKGIKADHDEACKIRRVRLEKFKPEPYKTIVAQMNELIDEFKELNRKHQINNQIVALSAYINQPSILKAWERLHSQGINSLAVLLEKKDIDASVLFHIWDLVSFSYKEFE